MDDINYLTFALLLEALNEGSIFPISHWPLHCTVISSFVLTGQLNNLLREIQKITAIHQLITLTVAGEAMFGPSNDIRVSLVQKNQDLQNLHDSILELLTRSGAQFKHPDHLGRNYTPHITVQPSGRVHEGQTVGINSLSLINQNPNNDRGLRQVMVNFPFGR